MEHKTLMEFFDLPLGAKLVDTVHGQKLYGSDKLNKKFLRAMEKTGRVKPIVPTLEKLIKRKILTPVYQSSGMIRFFLAKTFSPHPKRALAFYVPSTGRIYILIDSESNIFGLASDNELSVSTLHELVHKGAKTDSKVFMSLFKENLKDFYKFYWGTYFNVNDKDIPDKFVNDMVLYLFNKIELNYKNLKTKDIVTYLDKLKDQFKDKSTVGEEQFNRLMTSYINVTWARYVGINQFYSIVRSNRHVINPLYKAYNHAFNIPVSTIRELCYQELTLPSEVIALTAMVKQPDKKVYQLVKKI